MSYEALTYIKSSAITILPINRAELSSRPGTTYKNSTQFLLGCSDQSAVGFLKILQVPHHLWPWEWLYTFTATQSPWWPFSYKTSPQWPVISIQIMNTICKRLRPWLSSNVWSTNESVHWSESGEEENRAQVNRIYHRSDPEQHIWIIMEAQWSASIEYEQGNYRSQLLTSSYRHLVLLE